MNKSNNVFIATSLDGFIADKNGQLDWLHVIPNPDGIDMGYSDFISKTDALIMGRVSFETVLGFGIDWPYPKPVFVLSSTLKEIPEKLEDKVFIVNGQLKEILKNLNEKGYNHLYIDGGSTIQSFLREDLIDEMIITKIPVLLGGGTPLFKDLDAPLHFKCVKTEVFLDAVVQNHFKRIRD